MYILSLHLVRPAVNFLAFNIKRLYIFLFVLLLLSSCASHSSFDSYYNEHKRDARVAITFPKWVGMAFVPPDEKPLVKEIASGIRKIRIIYDEGTNPAAASLDNFLVEYHYDPYLYIKEDGGSIQVYAKGQEPYIHDFVISSHQDGETLILALSGKMNIRDFNRMLEDEILIKDSEE